MFISNKLSNNLINRLSKENIIERTNESYYLYIFHFFIDFFIYNGTILLIGILTHDTIETILFLLTLTPLKMYAGGAQ